MPGKSERLKVEVKETSDSELRTFILILAAPISDFQLTDLLKQRGVIGGLEVELKQAVKSATENYLRTAETLISGLVTKPAGQRRSLPDSNKDDRSHHVVGASPFPRKSKEP